MKQEKEVFVIIGSLLKRGTTARATSDHHSNKKSVSYRIPSAGQNLDFIEDESEKANEQTI